jgi:hypothetical protein
MQQDQLFTVASGRATPVRHVTLQEAGFRERDDLEEWVIANPSILGGEVMIVTAEFDRWVAASGGPQLDRLDVLGLRDDATLIVAELKRGDAPDTVDMQALKYAAYASQFTAQRLGEYHARFRASRGDALSEDDAITALYEFAPDLADGPFIPEITLVAERFPQSVTATAVFLGQVGLTVRLVTVAAYATASGEVILHADTIFPVPEVDDLMVKVRSSSQAATASARVSVRTVERLLNAGKPDAGTLLHLKPWHMRTETREAMTEWVEEDPRRGEAVWEPFPDPAHPLRWLVDDERYSATGLVKRIAEELGPEYELEAVQGPAQWVLDDGERLSDYARRIGRKPAAER